MTNEAAAEVMDPTTAERRNTMPLRPDESNITTGTGTVLTVKKLTPSGLLRIYEACGGFVPSPAWVRLAQYAVSVVAADGVPLPSARPKREIEQRADRIGEDGLSAVMRFFDDGDAGAEVAKN